MGLAEHEVKKEIFFFIILGPKSGGAFAPPAPPTLTPLRSRKKRPAYKVKIKKRRDSVKEWRSRPAATQAGLAEEDPESHESPRE